MQALKHAILHDILAHLVSMVVLGTLPDMCTGEEGNLTGEEGSLIGEGSLTGEEGNPTGEEGSRAAGKLHSDAVVLVLDSLGVCFHLCNVSTS